MNITFLKTKNNTYLFKVPSGVELIINGTIQVSPPSVYQGQDTELSVVPKKIVQVIRQQVVAAYQHVEDKELAISPEAYIKQRNILLSKRVLPNEDLVDEEAFASLDDEYAYKKFMAAWKPQYIQETKHVAVDFVIGGVIYSDYKEIVPLTLYGGDIEDRTCVLNLDPVETLKDICNELGIAVYYEKDGRPDAKRAIELPNHSAIRYAKFNGEYVFTDRDSYKSGYQVRNSYEKCIEELKRYKEGIRTLIVQHIHIRENKELSKEERKTICDELQTVLEILQKVEANKKTLSTFWKAKEKISGIHKKLKLPV